MAHDYPSLKDRVYSFLREQINAGNLKPSEKIREKGICSKLNVSRTPLREALMKLEGEKIIQIIPRHGFIVKKLTLKEIEEIFDAIGCLEGFAVMKAIANMKNRHFEEMDKAMDIMERYKEENDIDAFNKWNIKFHDVYIKASENDIIYEIVNSLKKRFYENPARRMIILPDWIEKAMQEHTKILNLLKSGKSIEAERFIREVHWNYENNFAFIKRAFLL